MHGNFQGPDQPSYQSVTIRGIRVFANPAFFQEMIVRMRRTISAVDWFSLDGEVEVSVICVFENSDRGDLRRLAPR